MTKKKPAIVPKRTVNKASFSLKKQIVDDILNGQINKRQSSIKYGIGRHTIDYWIVKFLKFPEYSRYRDQMEKTPRKEIQKLTDKIEELELSQDFLMYVINELEKETGVDVSKKYLPEQLYRTMQAKKRNRK